MTEPERAQFTPELRNPERPIILVVDDDREIRHAIIDFLDDEGFEGIGACNGEEALEILSDLTREPILILLDMMMPGMDGWTFCKVRQGVLMLKDIPVVAMSAAHVLQHHEPLRVEGLLPKPFEPKQLAKLAARMAGRKTFHGPKVG
jgi:two-component system response regulator ResD